MKNEPLFTKREFYNKKEVNKILRKLRKHNRNLEQELESNRVLIGMCVKFIIALHEQKNNWEDAKGGK